MRVMANEIIKKVATPSKTQRKYNLVMFYIYNTA